MDNKPYGICKKCGAMAVHLAMSAGINFYSDIDDDCGNKSIYEDVILEFTDEVSIGIHVCFECRHIEDAWVEYPREKEAGETASSP